MLDSYGREISYLRMSVTELCNLRCRYCMPADGICKKAHEEMLTEDEMAQAVRAAAALGIKKLRVTGGEPLVKKNIVSICRRCAETDGIRELCITTNGVLLPALMKGADTLLMTFIVCAYVAVVSLTIVGGVRKKTVCAMLGAVAGTALALLFGLLAQALTRVDGLRIDDVEPLLQLRQTGTPIGLRGLLVGGIVISALGAVMDVTMGIASSLAEVHAANPQLSRRELFRSGMNIGRDAMGTMANTLILAFAGSSLNTLLLCQVYDYPLIQIFNADAIAVEMIRGVAGSIGILLTVPLVALLSARLMSPRK